VHHGGPGAHLEGPALLVVDDEHAAHRARRERLRPPAPGGRVACRRRLGVGPPLPRRLLHGLALHDRAVIQGSAAPSAAASSASASWAMRNAAFAAGTPE